MEIMEWIDRAYVSKYAGKIWLQIFCYCLPVCVCVSVGIRFDF
jgi:hypothetical protein